MPGRRLAFDKTLFSAVLLLLGLGLVMVYSASAVLARERGFEVNPYFVKQAIAAVVGLLAMLAIMHVDYRLLRKPALVYMAIGGVVALLVAVLFAPSLNNSRRWFFVGGLSIQPSELAKLALVVFVAYQIDRKHDRINSYAFLLPVALATGLVGGLILLGRDLGSLLVLLVPPLVMAFVAGLSLRYLATGFLILAPVVAVSVLLEPYRMKRLLAFLHPEADPQGAGFQLLQSLIAIGSGGLLGLGPGNSMQKLYFLPSPHADFIFAIVAEELGLIGALFVVASFGVLLWRGAIAGDRAPDTFGRFLAWGFVTLVVVQALLHMSVVLALLPTTGLPLPFISHGGSSLVTTLVACGLVLNVSQHA